MSLPSSHVSQRLAELAKYEILDSAAEEDFDDIVRIASEVCGAPISLISLVDRDRQWFKASVGAGGLSETPIDTSVCAHALESTDDLFVVPDLAADERFKHMSLVTGGPKLRFYAGAPLRTPAGIPIGSLCVLADQPRDLDASQRLVLEALGRQVMTMLELRLALRQRQHSEEASRRIADDARSAREHLALIVDSARDFAILSLDINGLIISWNPGAERIFGYEADEAICRPIDLIFTPEDIENGAALREVEIARQVGRSSDERWHIRKDGTRFFASGIMAAMYDKDGKICGFTKIARDVTAQKEAEQALIEARNTAEAANIAKTEFLANMSHEIRTPMNAVIGLASILGMSEPLSEKQRQFVKTLQLSADSLLSLINDLLDISKIESHSVELERIPFSLAQMVQEVVSMMAVRAKEKSLRFTTDAECVEHRMFLGDPNRLRQIVLNLCSNAIKFTHEGDIRIAVSCRPDSTNRIGTVSIAVSDTGIGIGDDKLETIFQKFVQADSSISRKYGGTGLGLAITKTLAEIMDGSIEVKSEIGVGSTFTVHIPLPNATDMVPLDSVLSLSSSTKAETDASAKMRVLLVEDYAPNVLVASSFLEKFGYPHDVAGSGEEAVERIKTGLYSVALMDVQMHGMNGLEATRIIRAYEQSESLARLPIIGMTAHALTGDRERCLGVGMDDYISKPFNPDELREKLAACVVREAA